MLYKFIMNAVKFYLITKAKDTDQLTRQDSKLFLQGLKMKNYRKKKNLKWKETN